jgi:membrane protein CcdC involved in cytochrome C biogenesis
LSVPIGWSALAAVVGLTGVLIWRVREGRTPVTLKKIVMPPLGMATGFCMFIVPAFRVPLLWALLAFLAGAILLAYPLLATSRLHREGDDIMMKRSGAFFAVVVGLAVIRYAARGYLDTIMSVDQNAGLSFVLAFGMILRWRMSMLMEFRALNACSAE